MTRRAIHEPRASTQRLAPLAHRANATRGPAGRFRSSDQSALAGRPMWRHAPAKCPAHLEYCWRVCSGLNNFGASSVASFIRPACQSKPAPKLGPVGVSSGRSRSSMPTMVGAVPLDGWGGGPGWGCCGHCYLPPIPSPPAEACVAPNLGAIFSIGETAACDRGVVPTQQTALPFRQTWKQRRPWLAQVDFGAWSGGRLADQLSSTVLSGPQSLCQATVRGIEALICSTEAWWSNLLSTIVRRCRTGTDMAQT